MGLRVPKHDDASRELFPECRTPLRRVSPLPTLKVPAGTVGKRCGCGVTIYLVEQPSGRWAPITCSVPGGVLPSAKQDGIGYNHRIDCPMSDKYPRRR